MSRHRILLVTVIFLTIIVALCQRGDLTQPYMSLSLSYIYVTIVHILEQRTAIHLYSHLLFGASVGALMQAVWNPYVRTDHRFLRQDELST